MVLQFPVVLKIALIFSCTSSVLSLNTRLGGEDPDNEEEDNEYIYTSIFVDKYRENEIILNKYFNYSELENLVLRKLGRMNNKIVNVIEIGRAHQNKPIWAVRISRDVQEERKLLKPMFKFVANMDGDDEVGYALMVSLMQYIVYSDVVNPRITEMINNTDIWIIPTFNPYRLFNKSFSSSHFDDFDQDFHRWKSFPETESMMEFITSNKYFVLSGNLRAGAIVASYPFDYAPHKESSLTQDNDIFVKLAKDYAAKNSMMANGTACNNSFPDGITNGKYWGKKSRSVQDTNYLLSNCFELSFYLSCVPRPDPTDLPEYWSANLKSMLQFIESTRQGVYGLVKYNKPEYAVVSFSVVKVEGREKEIEVTERGEYWRLLVPGEYNITASDAACIPQTQTVTVTEKDPYVRLDFNLTVQGVSGFVNYDKISPRAEAVVEIEGEDKYTIVSKDHGMFGLQLELNRSYNLTAGAYGHTKQTKTVLLTESEPYKFLTFDLTRMGVNVSVLDRETVSKDTCSFYERAFKEATVKVMRERQEGEENYVREFQVPARGWSFKPLNLGTYKIMVSAPGYRSQTKTVVLTENESYVTKEFKLARQGIYGIVKDNNDEPVHGAVIQVKDKKINVAEDGIYSMSLNLNRCVTFGYDITVNAPGYIQKTKTVYLTKNNPSVEVSFVLESRK